MGNLQFKEIDTFGITENSFRQIHNLFAKYKSIEQVIIYGSRAKGNYRAGSDIDLTLKGNSLELEFLMHLTAEIAELSIPYKVDLSVFSKIDNPELLEHILRVGKIFYQK